MNTSVSASDPVTPTTADTTTNSMVSPVTSSGFNLFNRPEFVAGINSFREHFGQEVRSKITEGYTFLGLDKMGILHQHSNPSSSTTQTAKPKSTDGRSFQSGQPLAPPSVDSGTSQAHSSSSHPNNHVKGTSASSNNAKVSAPMQRDANRENLSTLDSLLSYMKRSPKPTTGASRVGGKFGQSAKSGASSSSNKFVKTVVLSQAKSRVDALDFSLSDHLSIDIPSIERLVSLQKGLAKLQAQVEQKQQREKEQQQKMRKQKQLEAAKVLRTKSDMVPDGKPKEQGKQKHVDGSSVVVEIERKSKESRAKSMADDRRRNGNIARELDPAAENDDERPRLGQKRPRSRFEFDVRIPKKARRQVIEALAATATNKRQAPVNDLNEELRQQPANKRARRLSKSTRNSADTELSSSYSTLHSSPPQRVSNSSSLSPKQTNSPASTLRKAALYKDNDVAAELKTAFLMHTQRLPRSKSPSNTRPGSRQRKEALDSEQPEADTAHKISVRTPSKSHLRDPDAKRARDSEKSIPGTSQKRALSRESTDGPLSAVSGGLKGVGANMQPSEVEQLRRQSTRLEGFMRSFKRSGDAERDPGGRVELEVGHYLESLSCCLEDFWCRRVVQSPFDMSKNWLTMLGICEYLYKRCDSRDLAALRGCTGLIAACVYYQLLSVSADMIQGFKDPDRAKQAIADISRYTSEMEKYEQVWRAQLSAHHVSRMFPQTWARCQEITSRLGPFETRSNPYTKKWPPVAYPVGATSNPLDVANFVRQIDHEWLNRLGLTLKMPNQKEA
ncbi:hypothetical protein IW138_001797 [Coemansia sp. RSA 986]|nr:hypothetical protein IW138_001797 [Coemansia sp. RSA 986]